MDTISHTFAALADPTRRAILARLALGETSVTELAAPFEMSMPAVSKHLRVLEKAGLVERGREAQFRPCRLRAQPLEQAVGWLEQYRQFWEQSFDRLDAYLQRIQAEQAATSPPGSPPTPAKAKQTATNKTRNTSKSQVPHKENGHGTRSRKPS
ncbi:DNA-binding transcriptional regulator, ArsR family [Bryocella elongata]|uniref:DNA-binding transcriptional regulator, ArsR family n=1 Tax=Bryocella elongata TaxID=863522 RepID=A0A1H6BL69_9BACT|nr:metalloregulator ArsR/SmtB family transcription factor [Bryocella elongata]SEG61127.1 DNA-binding transcriptional regulator, ArsR family [Bryocella elongata]